MNAYNQNNQNINQHQNNPNTNLAKTPSEDNQNSNMTDSLNLNATAYIPKHMKKVLIIIKLIRTKLNLKNRALTSLTLE